MDCNLLAAAAVLLPGRPPDSCIRDHGARQRLTAPARGGRVLIKSEVCRAHMPPRPATPCRRRAVPHRLARLIGHVEAPIVNFTACAIPRSEALRVRGVTLFCSSASCEPRVGRSCRPSPASTSTMAGRTLAAPLEAP